jgi:demethylmenaquinone methyltransferase / 2-methoxy-6-polyprenyl-1,4-benzoquinol methylase
MHEHQQHSAPSEESIAQMFDTIAPRYDFLNALLSFNQDKRWRKKLINLIPSKFNGVLVDMATGTGDVIIQAAKKHREYATFLGIDISSQMLKHAEDKVAKAGLEQQISFKLASCEQSELPAQFSDCVTIAFGLRNTIDKDQTLAEFYRILKPGGYLLILEFFPPTGSLLSRLFQFYFRRILPLIGGLFSSKAAYDYLPSSVQTFYTAELLREKLQKLSFYPVRTQSFLFGSCRLFAVKK